MSDVETEKSAAEVIAEAEAAQQAEAERLSKLTKRGFDLKARLEGRGLRRATITLFLDEELGAELGDAYDKKNKLDMVVGRERSGVLGKLDELLERQGNAEQADPALDEAIEHLQEQRSELIKKLNDTGLTLNLRAVPPVIQKDVHRKAKQTLEITEKGIPDEMRELFSTAEMAHLMALIIQSITDNATGTVNVEVTYDDAIALMELLPPSQFARLDEAIGKIQFTDAISRSIEEQEDFS